MRKNRRLWCYRLLVSTAIVLFVGEGAARIIHAPRIKQPRMGVYEGEKSHWGVPDYAVMARDEQTGRLLNRYQPNITYRHVYDGPGSGRMEPGNSITYKTNSWGFRDVEHQWDKPESTFRILILGDSFTWGEGTRFEETYPQRLAQALNSRQIDGQQIEVINMAIPGDNTSLAFATYYEYSEKIDPDLTLLQWNTNDFPVGAIARDHLKMIGVNYQEMYANSRKYEWSALVHMLWYTFRSRAISAELIEATNSEVERGAQNFEQISKFSQWVTAVADREFVVVVFPELIRFDDYPYSRIVDGLIETCAAQEIPCVNLLPALSEYHDHELWAHATDHHPNHLAHDIAAREIMAYLEKHWLDEQ